MYHDHICMFHYAIARPDRITIQRLCSFARPSRPRRGPPMQGMASPR